MSGGSTVVYEVAVNGDLVVNKVGSWCLEINLLCGYKGASKPANHGSNKVVLWLVDHTADETNGLVTFLRNKDVPVVKNIAVGIVGSKPLNARN